MNTSLRLTLVTLLLFLNGCDWFGKKSPESQREGKIGELSVFMQQRYRREVEKDGFEINYIPRENSILIAVRVKPNTSRTLISTLVESAKEIIRRKGQETYQLEQIDIDVELKELDGSSS